MIIIGCSGEVNFAKRLAKRLNCNYIGLYSSRFPDGEIYVRFLKPVSKQEIVLVQSFYGDINDKLIEVIFAASTAKELGAKSVTLVALYFPYLRQDKRFKSGEAVSIEIVAGLISKYVDRVLIMDPHLHRRNSLSMLFKVHAEKLSAYPIIADYIRRNIANPIIIGPDEESYKWAQTTAEQIGCEYAILRKKRFSARHVRVTLNKEIDVSSKTIVIVDDIISTGHTILETIKNLKKIGAEKIICICVHGIFIEGAFEKILSTGAEVVSCNTIPNNASKIDVTGLVAEGLSVRKSSFEK